MYIGSVTEQNRMPFQKGREKSGGRKKGVGNRVAREMKSAIIEALDGQLDKISEKLDEITDPVKWIEAISKILPYVIPKQREVHQANPFEGQSPEAVKEWLKRKMKELE